MPTSDIARAFGLGTPARDLTHVARGAMGEVFRLDTERGPFAVKRLLWGPQGEEEANAAFQFAAAEAGVPLARPLLTTNGDVLKRLDDGWWRAYEWVDGVHLAQRPATAAVATDVARALGRLHALAYDAGSHFDPWYHEPVGSARINAAIDVAVAHGWSLEARRRELLRLDDVIAQSPMEPLVGCHHDTGTTNVLIGEDRQVVLVDWDNAGPGVSECEFATALLQWACDDNDVADATVVVGMVAAYRAENARFAPRDLSVFATRCSAWVHYAVQCCEHLDDESVSAGLLAYERGTLQSMERNSRDTPQLQRLLELIPHE